MLKEKKKKVIVATSIAFLQILFLSVMLFLGIHYKGQLPDYIAFWPAGRLVLEGHYYNIYNIDSIIEVQRTVIPNLEALIMHVHPPFFLFFTVPLAYFNFYTSCFIWIILTSGFYAFICWKIAPHRYALIFSLFFPPFMISFEMVQTGAICTVFLASAFLIFGEKKAQWAGLCLALLIIKPHLGVLIPIALLASRQWKMIISASVWALLLFFVTIMIFDFKLWLSCLKIIQYFGKLYLGSSNYDILHYQSFFGFLQFVKVSNSLALGIQFIIGACVFFLIIYVWRSKEFCYQSQVGILVAGIFMFSPYIMMYDHTMLVISYLIAIRYFLDRDTIFSRTNLLFGLSFFCEVLIFAFRLPAGFFGAFFVMILLLLPENRKISHDHIVKSH